MCARLLEEKWRQAYHAIFRFGRLHLIFSALSRFLTYSTGPCQPSMVYRYLRTLEGVTPPLSLTHLSCQITAKAFVATRMRPLFLRPLFHTHTEPFQQFSIECSPWGCAAAGSTRLH